MGQSILCEEAIPIRDKILPRLEFFHWQEGGKVDVGVTDPVAAEEVIETTMPAILQSEPTDTFEFVSTNGADNIGGVNGTGNTGIGNGNGNVGGFNGNNNGGDFNGNGNVGGGVNGNGNGNSDADVDFAAFLPVEEFQTWQDFVPDWDGFFA